MSDIEETPIETYNDVEPEFTGDANTTEVKLFGKWSFDDIEVRDISLEVSIFYSSLVTWSAAALNTYDWMENIRIKNTKVELHMIFLIHLVEVYVFVVPQVSSHYTTAKVK